MKGRECMKEKNCFRTRFYKDQAYLTHTLPVKTSTILVARMVCDIVLVIGISISWVISLCIAFGDAGFYKDLVDFILMKKSI